MPPAPVELALEPEVEAELDDPVAPDPPAPPVSPEISPPPHAQRRIGVDARSQASLRIEAEPIRSAPREAPARCEISLILA
jgi:hypothetical protein